MSRYVKCYLIPFFVSLCMISSLVFSDDINGVDAGVSVSVDDFLSSLRNKNNHTISGDFEQKKHVTMLPVPLVSKGKYSFSNETGLDWNTLEPFNQSLIITEQGMFIKEGENSREMPSSSDVVAKIFLSLFTRDFALLANYFEIENPSQDVENWHLRMTPLSKGLAAYITEVSVAGGANTDSLIIIEANGDSTEVTLLPYSNDVSRAIE